MSLQNILDFYPQLVDSEFVFKSCEKDWIVVLEKLPDTLTNESRNVVDKRYAKYRADKLKVIMIFNKYDPKETKLEISNSVFEKSKINYKVGEIVSVDNFNLAVDTVCTRGIHYYTTIEPAFYQEKPKTGFYMSWYENGKKMKECEYVGGKYHSKHKFWYRNGQIKTECQFVNGQLDGKVLRWHENGQQEKESYFTNGKKYGKHLSWHANGQKSEECDYVNGKKYGKYYFWYLDGQKWKEMEFINGVRNCKFVSWYPRGQTCCECYFVDGKKHGKYIRWHQDGSISDELEFNNGKRIGRKILPNIHTVLLSKNDKIKY